MTAAPHRQRKIAIASGSNGRLDVEFNCGTLDVATADGSAWNVSGVSPDGRAPVVDVDPSGAVTIKGPNRGFDFVTGRTAWSVVVPRAPHVTLGLTLNAGDGSASLAGASVDGLDLTVNAGSMDLDLSGVAALARDGLSGTVSLSMNAGSLTVCAPAGTAMEVHWSGTIASHDLGAAGLVKTGDNVWTTAGFIASSPHVTLDVSANAGSFSFQLGGSCGA